MTRWPPRRKPADGMPAPLRVFVEVDWREWLLEGPDPAAEVYADGDLERFYRLHAARPAAWHQAHRRLDAHRRWSAARVAWLKSHGLPWLAAWIDDVNFEHRVFRRELREVAG